MARPETVALLRSFFETGDIFREMIASFLFSRPGTGTARSRRMSTYRERSGIGRRWIGLVVGTGCAILAPAAQAEEPEEKGTTTQLPPVVVTATRTEQSTSKVGGTTVSVITAKDIEEKGQTTVEEVLKGIPGIDIAATGGPGTQSSIFVRGADSKNVLVLVDGVMFNDPSGTNRGSDLANLTVDNIERIEVVRGPLSALYGSNATAGVVNIITKKGKGPISGYAGAEYGSYGTWRSYGGISGGGERYDYSLSVSRTSTDGFSAANDDNDAIPHAGNTDEDDGWDNLTVSGNVGVKLLPNVTLRLTGRYQDSRIETDDWGPGYAGDQFAGWPAAPVPGGPKEQNTESEQYTGRLALECSHFDGRFDSTPYIQLGSMDREIEDADGNWDSSYDGQTLEYGWQGGLFLGASNRLSFGASRFEEQMSNQSTYGAIPEKETYTNSLWIQDQWQPIEGLDLVGGLRWDDHEQFGSKTTFRVAPAYTFGTTGTTLKASYGTGFRSPSLYELYSSYGNPDLDAEESRGWDAGIVQKLADDRVELGATYFHNVFDNRIFFDMNTYMYGQDDGKTTTCGVELYAAWQATEDLSLRATYTYTDTEDPNGDRLVRRPIHKAFANANYRLLDNLSLNLDVIWAGERDAISSAADATGTPVGALDSYTVVNLGVTYDITENIRIYGRVDNLFDEEYEEAWSYATPGLSGHVGMRVSF
jgi:vitamin B12 transporter